MNIEDQLKALVIIVEKQSAEIELLRERIVELESENKELRRRLDQNSSNSSKPPSSDSIFKRPDRPSAKKVRKNKPGGQIGHKGSKLKRFEKVDFHIDHILDCCPNCNCVDLILKKKYGRQVVDIPAPKVEVTQHIFYEYSCKQCGVRCIDELSKSLNQEAQYGPSIKSLVNYLNVYQLIPYKRLTELIKVISGQKISQGSISNFNKEAKEKLGLFINQMKERFQSSSAVVHSDETGCMVSKSLYWVHVYSNNINTYLQGSTSRGTKAIEEIGIIPKMEGTLIHDRFRSYFQYTNIKHGLCNAHILREIKAAQENNKMEWLEKIKKILINAKTAKDKKRLKKNSAKFWQSKFEKILRNQRVYYQNQNKILQKKKPKGPVKRSLDHNLYNALWKYRNEILLFMYHDKVPFDNNLAERDLRMIKVKMKVSNQFKDLEWLNVHTAIRSFISTASKRNLNIMDSLKNLHGKPDSIGILAV